MSDAPIMPPIKWAPAAGDVRDELRMYADQFPMAGRALAEIERLRSVLVDVVAASDFQPCHHARIASKGLGLPVNGSVPHE